jgi:hypothetical protein
MIDPILLFRILQLQERPEDFFQIKDSEVHKIRCAPKKRCFAISCSNATSNNYDYVEGLVLLPDANYKIGYPHAWNRDASTGDWVDFINDQIKDVGNYIYMPITVVEKSQMEKYMSNKRIVQEFEKAHNLPLTEALIKELGHCPHLFTKPSNKRKREQEDDGYYFFSFLRGP